MALDDFLHFRYFFLKKKLLFLPVVEAWGEK
jgi:hypothetical protein